MTSIPSVITRNEHQIYQSEDKEYMSVFNSSNTNANSYERAEYDLSGKIVDYGPKLMVVDKYSSSSSTSSSSSSPSPKVKHPNNVPYDPLVHTTSKPPYSFRYKQFSLFDSKTSKLKLSSFNYSSLIFMAIEDSVQKALPVKEIYAWIVQHFPYFKTAPTGWKNSVRHNLSLNKCFQKVEKAAVSDFCYKFL
jgi:hypothetical protein